MRGGVRRGRGALGSAVLWCALIAAPDTAGAVAYVVGNSDRVALIDQCTGSVTGAVPLGASFAGSLAAAPDGQRLYVSSAVVSGPGALMSGVQFLDTATRSVVASLPLSGAAHIALSPDGSRLYVGAGYGGGDDLTVVDTASATVVDTVPVGHGNTDVTVNPAGTRTSTSRTNGSSETGRAPRSR